ncbi:hypothetical protein [Methylobacterium nigriterrae]|uniref:hypothetical protein n=1 Tax=Methylobacterium nigriterrae TaxID=3127512 RepID=UPI003013A049
MSRPLQAYVITTEPARIAGKEPVTRRWAVLAENVETAAELVRERVAPECIVEATDEILAPEEASAVGLQPHHAVGL